MAKQIDLNLKEYNYSILIGKNILNKAVKRVNKINPDKCLFIIDKKVFEFHGLNIRSIFSGVKCKLFTYIYSSSEKNKNYKEVIKIQEYLINNNFSRGSLIISIGGGITGDLAAFAASTFMRGIRLVHIPTTLLSMVDSSVGGKTGINFSNRKNIIGTFYQPDSVFIDPLFLNTLPEREILSGAGEMIKYSFLADRENYEKLKNYVFKTVEHKIPDFNDVVFRSLSIKKSIVENDEREITGLRKVLNFGHTFAHAFEAASKYKISHGEAVYAGIICALQLSSILGYLSEMRLNGFLLDYKFFRLNPILKSLNNDELLLYMKDDKKSYAEQAKFVLLQDIGSIVVDVPVEKTTVLESIKKMKKLI